MNMWTHVAGALALTWAALVVLDRLGVTALFAGRSGDDAVQHEAQQTWARDLFWLAIFAAVMATALLAAARRGVGHLKRALTDGRKAAT